MTTVPTVEQRLESLEREVAELQAKDAIRELAAVYQRGCDGGWDGGTHRDPDALTALFAQDAVYALPGMPEARGHDEIRALFGRLQSIPWIIHYVANSIIEVEGDTARGDVKGSAALFRDGEHRTLTFGTYHGRFSRTRGHWLFAEWRYVRAQQPGAATD
ncbi:MAG: nuclear transport factor 2 family protein [Aeromicrobium sp.]